MRVLKYSQYVGLYEAEILIDWKHLTSLRKFSESLSQSL